MKTIAVILGSPAGESVGRRLAEDYVAAARDEGAEVTLIDVAALRFDPDLVQGFRGDQPLEPDLAGAQAVLGRADHWVFVHPNWWGTYPARLKGFLDRLLLPGFAFRYAKGKALPEKLLRGKTARLLVTMDGPSWWYRRIMGAGGDRALVKSTLWFCGIRTLGVHHADRLRPHDRAPVARHRAAVVRWGRRDGANR